MIPFSFNKSYCIEIFFTFSNLKHIVLYFLMTNTLFRKILYFCLNAGYFYFIVMNDRQTWLNS